MKSISKIYLTISFIVLFILLGSILFFEEETKRDALQEVRKFVVEDFEKLLAFEKANLITFALALSEDGALKQTLRDNNDEEGYKLLDSIAERFAQNTHLKTLHLQILNTNFQIFAQNWKKTSMGEPILRFRKDLEKLRDNKKAKVGLETGRRLTFKSTVPIKYGEKYLGYLEVIKFLDEFTEKLRQRGIEVSALMDKKYIIKNDSLMKNFPRFKGYVIVNENYNAKLLAKVNKFSWNKLEEQSYYKYEGMLFMLKSMLNAEGEKIGEYLIVLPKNTLHKYQKSRQNISLLTRFSDEDIYRFVKQREELSGAYQNVHDRDMIELLPRLSGSEKSRLKKLVRTRLKDYTKEELINVILEKVHKGKKSGEIR